MSLHVLAQKAFGGFTLDVDLSFGGGSLGILGASGSGKSMTLKTIAGIETPHSGRIVANEQVLFDSTQKINLRPQQRRVGYLFQQYALFPHMSVTENIACALNHLPKRDRGPIIKRLLGQFHIEELSRHLPSQLSGGQQQRVALARIFAYEPKTLLLDEPFSALDSYLKEQLQLELRDMLRGYEGNVVLVTHNRDEAYQLCDEMLVLDEGRCIACGNTKALFAQPGLVSVARLTGCKNFSRAAVTGTNTVFAQDWGFELTVAGPIPNGFSHIGIRAHSFVPKADGGEPNTFAVNLQERLESPFEHNLLFSPAAGASPAPIWWKVDKTAGAVAVPAFLHIAPEKILLLRD